MPQKLENDLDIFEPKDILTDEQNKQLIKTKSQLNSRKLKAIKYVQEYWTMKRKRQTKLLHKTRKVKTEKKYLIYALYDDDENNVLKSRTINVLKISKPFCAKL